MGIVFENQSLIVLTAYFLAIFLLCLGLIQFRREQKIRRNMLRKIRNAAGVGADGADTLHAEGNPPRGRSLLFRTLARVGGGGARAKANTYSEGRLRFLNAGLRGVEAPGLFWGVKILLLVAVPSLFVAAHFTYFKQLDYLWTLTGVVAACLLGYYSPDLWLRRKCNLRRERIRKALPDALDLMVICVEAGMGLDSALNRVAQETRETGPELSDELQLSILELRAGKQRPEALRNLALRADLEEVHSLTTLLVQTDKFGTSLAQALRVYSESFRTQRYQRAEEIAAKLPVKLVFPVVCFIFPSLFVVILGPAAITIYNNIFKAIE